ncbi:Type II secretion system protein F [Roseimaritima multifibrata]|uniref:Type II secretion system protein F n=2 Tax=Roseimaritima multifibrata TaxID=1930274 RepID=A0A517MA84_9BACT|nr:Type II secretion system protein F [Roseimaritima multifibrata]
MGITTAAGFSRRFGTGHKAGADTLMLLMAEAKSGSTRHRQAMLNLIEGLKEGQTLSKSMRAENGYFPKLMVSMMEVGELTGRLERTMAMVADHYEHRVKMRRQFLTWIAWPLIQLLAGVFVIAMLIVILGVLKPAGGGEMLDFTGLGLRGFSGAAIFLFFVGLFFAGIAGIVIAIRKNFLGCHNLIPLFYMIPVLGPAIRTITLAKFCWVLSLTLDTGLDAIRSVKLALDSTGSDYYRGGIKPATDAIQKGQSLSKSLRAADVLPDEFLVQVEVAELSGTDAESIGSLAVEYDGKAKMAIKTLSGILSGVIWLLVIVVFVVMIMNMLININSFRNDALQPI